MLWRSLIAKQQVWLDHLHLQSQLVLRFTHVKIIKTMNRPDQYWHVIWRLEAVCSKIIHSWIAQTILISRNIGILWFIIGGKNPLASWTWVLLLPRTCGLRMPVCCYVDPLVHSNMLGQIDCQFRLKQNLCKTHKLSYSIKCVNK